LDTTPQYLKNDGVSDIPLAIPLSVITKARSEKDAYHSIKDSKLAKLQEGIRNPKLVIDNPKRNFLIFVTSIKQAGLPVVIAFEKNKNFDGDNVHKATSIHLRENIETLFNDLSPDAKIYFANKNELNGMVGVTNNLRSLADNIKFIEEIVQQNNPVVNGQKSVGQSGLEKYLDSWTSTRNLEKIKRKSQTTKAGVQSSGVGSSAFSNKNVSQTKSVVNNQHSVGRGFEELAKTPKKITVLRKIFSQIKQGTSQRSAFVEYCFLFYLSAMASISMETPFGKAAT